MLGKKCQHCCNFFTTRNHESDRVLEFWTFSWADDVKPQKYFLVAQLVVFSILQPKETWAWLNTVGQSRWLLFKLKMMYEQAIGDSNAANMQKSFKFYTAFPVSFPRQNKFFICSENSLYLQKKKQNMLLFPTFVVSQLPNLTIVHCLKQ